MLRLRCYMFGRLVREGRDRHLSHEETDFLERHRCECPTCSHREQTTNCSLGALGGMRIGIKQAESHHELIHKVANVRPQPAPLPHWVTWGSSALVLGAIALAIAQPGFFINILHAILGVFESLWDLGKVRRG